MANASNIYVGIWNPNSGSLPHHSSSITFAQYFVTEAGSFIDSSLSLNLSFNLGDWLIFIVDDDYVEHWYKTAGGLVTVSSIGNSNNINQGWYSKVYINGNGEITDAGYISEDDDSGSNTLPAHTHTSSEITDFSSAIWPIVEKIFKNQV